MSSLGITASIDITLIAPHPLTEFNLNSTPPVIIVYPQTSTQAL